MEKKTPTDPLEPITRMGDGVSVVHARNIYPSLGAAYERLPRGVGRPGHGKVTDQRVRYPSPFASPIPDSAKITTGETGPPLTNDLTAPAVLFPQRAWRTFSPIHFEELMAFRGAASPSFPSFQAKSKMPRSYEEVLANREEAVPQANRPSNPMSHLREEARNDMPSDPRLIEVMRATGHLPMEPVQVSSNENPDMVSVGTPSNNRPMVADTKRSITDLFSKPPKPDDSSMIDAHEDILETSVPNILRSMARSSRPDERRAMEIAIRRAEVRFEREAKIFQQADSRNEDTTADPVIVTKEVDRTQEIIWKTEAIVSETERRLKLETRQQLEVQAQKHSAEIQGLISKFDEWMGT